MSDRKLEDVQNSPAEVAIPIDRVGIKGVNLPVKVRSRAHGQDNGSQSTVAKVDLVVDLPAHFKGTHMSRFVEALEHWAGDLSHSTFKNLLTDIRDRLQARSADVSFWFPYFQRRQSPASKAEGFMKYDCCVRGHMVGGDVDFTLTVAVPVMTVCPCSLALCDDRAGHSQRAKVTIQARAKGFLWLEDLIAIGEAAGSSPVYSLLKREDEKAVTEAAFANPAFVEDVVRAAARALSEHPRVASYVVEVESFESIHDHSAYAMIEG